MAETKATEKIDVLGKKCPEPNMMIKDKLCPMNAGDILEIIGDSENRRSIERFVKMRGHEVVDIKEEGDCFNLFVKKSAEDRGDIPKGSCGLK
ncbi:sulfurtransferase TusA family protein [Chloroflexota bacterium]